MKGMNLFKILAQLIRVKFKKARDVILVLYWLFCWKLEVEVVSLLLDESVRFKNLLLVVFGEPPFGVTLDLAMR